MEIKTEFTERIRISPIKLDWIKKNKGQVKTAAAFLDQILDDFIKPNLFKNGQSKTNRKNI